MIYELLDTAEHPLVVVATIEDTEHEHPQGCACGGTATRVLKVAIEGAAPAGLKALGLLSAVATLISQDDTDTEDFRVIRRALAQLLEMTS